MPIPFLSARCTTAALWLTLGLAASCPAIAVAQTRPGEAGAAADGDVDPSRDAEARSLFEAGRTAFRDGRFGDAREHFQRSYDLSHRPSLLYNIASADDRLRRDAAALSGFEEYLRLVPDAANRAEVEARIVALRSAVSAREASPSPTVAGPEPGGPTVLWSWVTGGLALVSGGLAVGFWVAAQDQYGGLERGCLMLRGRCTPEEVASSGVEASVTMTNVFLVSSIVLAAATAIVLPIELTAPTSSGHASAALELGPGALRLRGTF